jgi:hypothetical protein
VSGIVLFFIFARALDKHAGSIQNKTSVDGLPSRRFSLLPKFGTRKQPLK